MTKDLPAAPLPDDVIDRVAKEVAAQVRDHIEQMYPAAATCGSAHSHALQNFTETGGQNPLRRPHPERNHRA